MVELNFAVEISTHYHLLLLKNNNESDFSNDESMDGESQANEDEFSDGEDTENSDSSFEPFQYHVGRGRNDDCGSMFL